MTEVINLINYFSSYFFASGSSARELARLLKYVSGGRTDTTTPIVRRESMGENYAMLLENRRFD